MISNLSKPSFVQKPLWGHEEIIVNNDNYCLKRLGFMRGHWLSLQYHREKHETHYGERGLILFQLGRSGKALTDLDDEKKLETFVLRPGEIVTIEPLTIHRVGGLKPNSTILEVSTRHENSDTYKVEPQIPGTTNLIPEKLMGKYGF